MELEEHKDVKYAIIHIHFSLMSILKLDDEIASSIDASCILN